EDIFLVRINVDVVRRAGKRRRLDEGADRRWVIALDIPLELRSEAFDLPVVSGEFSAAAADIERISADKFFLTRALQILPARCPCHCGIRYVVWSRRLPEQLRQISIAGASIQVLAQVAAKLPAGIRDTGRPMLRLRIQHDVRRL